VRKSSILLITAMCLISGGFCLSEETNREVTDFWRGASPTDGFWGLNDKLVPSGIEIGLGLTSVYQSNVHGGASTNDRRGRYVGRYDLELSAELGKLLGIEGGSLFLHGWGGWPDTEGIDGHSVGSAWGINALSVGNRSMDIVEFFYEGPFFGDNLTLAIGKLDFTGIFDASEYADDECCQFLNASLVDDPAIPFPEQGLGFVLNWDITDSWYLMAGVADAQADSRETGFKTTFHNKDYFFYAFETGKTLNMDSANGSMPGTYRIGMWIDSQDKERFSDNGQTHRDDTGFYTSCDQMLYKENANIEDTQGLGVFFRYGWADDKVNEVTNFWSIGLQYQGLFEGRDEDVMGVGFAHGTFSDDATDYIEDYESVLEVYYNAQVTPWLSLSPSIQYVANPGGGKNAKDAVVIGLRAQMIF